MKKLSLLAVCISIAIVAFSQNGGQANENPSVKIEQVAVAGSYTIVRVTNKQACQADIRVTSGGDQFVKSIAPGATDTFWVETPPSMRIQARTETNCGTTDFGQVELTVTGGPGGGGGPLAIKSLFANMTKLSNGSYKLTIYSDEDDTINYYNIDVDFGDGKPVRRTLLFPDGLVGSKKYTVILKK